MGLKVLHIVAIFYLITEITAQCRVELPQDTSLKPKFHKIIGSHIATVSNELSWIDLQNDEIITAHCDTKFTKPNPTNIPSITIDCQGGNIKGYYSSNVYFECDSLKWNLYESQTSFRWCPPTMISYIIARPWGKDYEYLAGICYDFLEMSVVSLHYAVTPKFSKFVYPLRLRHYTPDLEINNIPTKFVARNISSIMYDNPQFQQWIQFANYQNHSLIQNPKLYRENYQQFGGLLECIWWTGLRLGNWRHYEEALTYHLETDSLGYDILSGISGHVSAPIYKKDNCHRNRTMVELVDRTNRKIPLYVWQYLKSPRNDSDNLVIIGINSPFQEFYDETDLIFCNDICHEIEWLQNVYATFQYKTMGTVFCCTVADVQASKRLNGFPIPPKPVKPIPKPLPVIISNNLDRSFGDIEEIESSVDENDSTTTALEY